jgi:hypothetical protein
MMMILICRSKAALYPGHRLLPFAVPSFHTTLCRKNPHFGRHFSSSPLRMTATKIDGTAIAKSIRERLGAEIKKKQESNPRYKPSLKIVQGTTRSIFY